MKLKIHVVIVGVLCTIALGCGQNQQESTGEKFDWSTLSDAFTPHEAISTTDVRIFCDQAASSRNFAFISTGETVEIIYTTQNLDAYDGSANEVLAENLACEVPVDPANGVLVCRNGHKNTYTLDQGAAGLDLFDHEDSLPYPATGLECFRF